MNERQLAVMNIICNNNDDYLSKVPEYLDEKYRQILERPNNPENLLSNVNMGRFVTYCLKWQIKI